MTGITSVRKPPPSQAIAARQREADAKLAAVRNAIKTLARIGAPVTRAGIAALAGVSRSFTYQNDTANTLITTAQQRSHTRQINLVDAMTAQQEVSWRERALNAEEQIRSLNRELGRQRQLVADLLGQLRDPDGTWLEHDRARLRDENQRLLHERNQLVAAQYELQRKLDGARANVAQLNTARVTQLFPDGPGPDRAS
jgi:D-mannonate dehydratase